MLFAWTATISKARSRAQEGCKYAVLHMKRGNVLMRSDLDLPRVDMLQKIKKLLTVEIVTRGESRYAFFSEPRCS